jgi:hypothetical protein
MPLNIQVLLKQNYKKTSKFIKISAFVVTIHLLGSSIRPFNVQIASNIEK